MSEIYKRSMLTIGKCVPQKFQPLWNHPAGPQTIFFWAPAFKWIKRLNDKDIKDTLSRLGHLETLKTGRSSATSTLTVLSSAN